MKTRGMLLYFGAIAAVMAVGMAARADSVLVRANYTGDSPTENVNITTNPNILGVYNTGPFLAGPSHFTTISVTNAGSISTDLDTSKVSTYLGSSFVGYCIDLGHLIEPGTFSWNVGELTNVTWGDNNPLSQDQADAITYLWNTYRDDSNGAHAAAFQIALWDLVYLDPSTNFANSTLNPVYFSNNATAIANGVSEAQQSWAHRDDPIVNAKPVYALISVGTQQSFSITIVGAETVPVPLPAAAGVGFAMLAGFGGMFGLRKTMKRKASIA